MLVNFPACQCVNLLTCLPPITSSNDPIIWHVANQPQGREPCRTQLTAFLTISVSVWLSSDYQTASSFPLSPCDDWKSLLASENLISCPVFHPCPAKAIFAPYPRYKYGWCSLSSKGGKKSSLEEIRGVAVIPYWSTVSGWIRRMFRRVDIKTVFCALVKECQLLNPVKNPLGLSVPGT